MTNIVALNVLKTKIEEKRGRAKKAIWIWEKQ